MKKQILVVCAVMMFVVCLSLSPLMAADKCILWGYKWNTMSDYDYFYAWLYEDGTWVGEGGDSGTWEKFGGSFKLQYDTGCQPVYAGTKRQGFMECTLEGFQTLGENYYMIKGTNKKNCIANIPATTTFSGKVGPSGASPE